MSQPIIGVWDADEPKQETPIFSNSYPLGRYKRKVVNIVACSWIHNWADVLFLGEGNAIKRVELSEIKNTKFRIKI